jgi:diguanylate cyclase (GGDEF)-like protein
VTVSPVTAVDAPEISGAMAGVALRYVRNAFGDDGVARLLALAGDPRPPATIEDPGSWTSYRHMIRLFQAAAEVTGESGVVRRIGAEMLRQYEGGEVAELLRSLGSPGELLRNIATTGAKFSTVSRYDAVAIGERSAVLTATGDSSHGRHPLMCEFTKGILSQTSVLFGLAPARVHETQCQARGAPCCTYEIEWGEAELGDADRAEQLEAQVARLTRQLDSVLSTATELLAADDVETVLGRIARRAGSAVRAPRYVLAVRVSDDVPMAVSQKGFSDDEAAIVAAELLGDGGDQPGRLVVDVTSTRRHYGRLAALFPNDQGFFAQERRLLEIYANYAAAVLDMAVALEESKRRDNTARALLQLAGRMAKVGTRIEVAGRLAEAIPEIVGAPQSAVLLWDPHERLLRTAAHVGFTEEIGQLLDALTIAEGDTAFLGQMIEHPGPVHFNDNHTDPYMSALLAAVDVPATVVVPLVAHGDFHGILSTPLVTVDDDLVERLEGLAAHGASALANAALVERLTEHATIDDLTGLVNRRMLTDRLEELVRTSARRHTQGALLFIDLDDFKLVNDSLGHEAGDGLLVLLASRLKSAVRPGDVVGRLGGDEFAVLLPDTDGAGARLVADRLLDIIGAPVEIDGHQLVVKSSIGLAMADGSVSADELLRIADLAMYAAKAAGGGEVSGLSGMALPSRRSTSDGAFQLRRAIEHDELVLHYQPIVNLRSGEIVGGEALLRWPQPDGRLRPPAEFLPIAERSRLIGRLDDWVLRRAALDSAYLQREFPNHRRLAVSVNLSSATVMDPDLPGRVRSMLEEIDLDPSRLVVELTERQEVPDVAGAQAVLSALGSLGVRSALDDWGTAYSSLAYLDALPVAFLKLDRFLLERSSRSGSTMRLLAGTIALAHQVEVQVVIEGIEDPGQLALVRELGADYGQGYLLGRPEPLEALCRRILGLEVPLPS